MASGRDEANAAHAQSATASVIVFANSAARLGANGLIARKLRKILALNKLHREVWLALRPQPTS
jgi:hypothetical protein